MKDADELLLLSLRQAGCEVPDGVDSLAGLDAITITAMCASCLQLIQGSKMDPALANFVLPADMSGRFRTCSRLATAIAGLGYRGEIGFQQLLYPTEQDTRRLMLFFLERLPGGGVGGGLGGGGRGGAAARGGGLSGPGRSGRSKASLPTESNAEGADVSAPSVAKVLSDWMKQADVARASMGGASAGNLYTMQGGAKSWGARASPAKGGPTGMLSQTSADEGSLASASAANVGGSARATSVLTSPFRTWPVTGHGGPLVGPRVGSGPAPADAHSREPSETSVPDQVDKRDDAGAAAPSSLASHHREAHSQGATAGDARVVTGADRGQGDGSSAAAWPPDARAMDALLPGFGHAPPPWRAASALEYGARQRLAAAHRTVAAGIRKKYLQSLGPGGPGTPGGKPSAQEQASLGMHVAGDTREGQSGVAGERGGEGEPGPLLVSSWHDQVAAFLENGADASASGAPGLAAVPSQRWQPSLSEPYQAHAPGAGTAPSGKCLSGLPLGPEMAPASVTDASLLLRHMATLTKAGVSLATAITPAASCANPWHAKDAARDDVATLPVAAEALEVADGEDVSPRGGTGAGAARLTPAEVREAQLASLTLRGEQLQAEVTQLEQQLGGAPKEAETTREALSAARRERERLDRSLRVLQVATELAMRTDGTVEDSEAAIQRAIGGLREQLAEYRAEWDQHRTPLEARLEELRAGVSHSEQALADKARKAAEARAAAQELSELCRVREEQQAALTEQLNKLPHHVDRGLYVRRIMEIIKNIKHQDACIQQIVGDTRELQRGINASQEALQRVHALTDDRVFRDAKKDLLAKDIYQHLCSIHEDFGAMVTATEKAGAAERAARELSVKIDALAKHPLSQAGVASDLEAIRNENRALELELRALASTHTSSRTEVKA
eukprot:jgi/Mesvir1/17291/Mv07693-RA.2